MERRFSTSSAEYGHLSAALGLILNWTLTVADLRKGLEKTEREPVYLA